MAFNNSITTMIFGRRLGLQSMSSNVSGAGTSGTQREFLVGPDGFRQPATTSVTTGINLSPSGISVLSTISSSCVFVLDPPIPGVEKTIVFGSTGGGSMYVRTQNSETIWSTLGSSHTTLKSTVGNGGSVRLVGVTTAAWAWISLASTIIAAATTST